MAGTLFSRRQAMRLLLGSAVGAAALTKASPIALAQADNKRVVDTDLLNLREGAGLSFPILETLPTGTELIIDSSQRQAADGINWIFVTVVASSSQGWVDSSYLSLATTETGTPTGGSESTKWVSVADANLRDAAGFVSSIIAMLPIGQEVTVTGASVDADGYTWHPVTADGDSGWMADIVLTDTVPPSPGFDQGAAITVNTDLLNLRDEPGINTGILETYTFGTTGTILSASPSSVDNLLWHQVELDDDGATGWFAEMYLSSTSGTPGSDAIEVADGPLNLRETPGLDGEIVTTLATGTTAKLLSSDFTAVGGYQWVNVRLQDQSGTDGWLASEFCTFV